MLHIVCMCMLFASTRSVSLQCVVYRVSSSGVKLFAANSELMFSGSVVRNLTVTGNWTDVFSMLA
jgi:hypothetical protein